jgi:hypothetical protein
MVTKVKEKRMKIKMTYRKLVAVPTCALDVVLALPPDIVC